MLAEMTRFLRHIRSFVTEDMAASIPNAMVLLQLTPFWLFILQHSKTPTHSKYCCRDCFETQRLCRFHQLLQRLHWIPVYFRIKYKIATLTCKTHRIVSLNQPLYLTHLLAPYTSGRSLRSQDEHLLLEPAVSTVIGSRGFSYAAQHL